MNQQEKKELRYFPKALDQSVKEKFGIECESSFDFFGSGNYTTNFQAEGQLKIDIENYIAGYIAGNLELRGRMESLKNQSCNN